jgi:hypothetical protein
VAIAPIQNRNVSKIRSEEINELNYDSSDEDEDEEANHSNDKKSWVAVGGKDEIISLWMLAEP